MFNRNPALSTAEREIKIILEPEVKRSKKTRRLKRLLHFHQTIHDSPMTWEGTYIWIITRG